MEKTEKKATKLVEVKLAALTRVEYMEVVEVPADITPEELAKLVDDRYTHVDGGEYTSDSEYWQRGACSAEDSDMPDATPSMVAFRTEQGLQIELAEAKQGYLASAGWGHIFFGRREEMTRWIYDLSTKKLAAAQVLNGASWVNMEAYPMADLLRSIHDNDAIADPAGFGFDLIYFDSLPSWQEVNDKLVAS